MKKSMVDVAFDLMTRKKKPVVFLKLWQEVSEIMGFTPAQEEDNIAQFYGDLSLDDRFVNVLEKQVGPSFQTHIQRERCGHKLDHYR